MTSNLNYFVSLQFCGGNTITIATFVHK